MTNKRNLQLEYLFGKDYQLTDTIQYENEMDNLSVFDRIEARTARLLDKEEEPQQEDTMSHLATVVPASLIK